MRLVGDCLLQKVKYMNHQNSTSSKSKNAFFKLDECSLDWSRNLENHHSGTKSKNGISASTLESREALWLTNCQCQLSIANASSLNRTLQLIRRAQHTVAVETFEGGVITVAV